jgi:hypothetical protein
MESVAQSTILFKVPSEEQLEAMVGRFQAVLGDVRLVAVVRLMLQGIIAARSPVASRMAGSVPHTVRKVFYVAKRVYRFCQNPRLGQADLLVPACTDTAERASELACRGYILVALDPVNLEKPYARAMEALQKVPRKASARGISRTEDLQGQKKRKELIWGYPLMVALALGRRTIGLTYAHLFSSRAADFVSQNVEVAHAVVRTLALLAGHVVRFVADSGFDDQKLFAFIDRRPAQFVIRLCHDRSIEVRNEPLQRWEPETLLDFSAVLWQPITFMTRLKRHHRWERAKVTLGYQKVRLPGIDLVCWLIVAHTEGFQDPWLLLSNVPILNDRIAVQLWQDYRRRGGIEAFFRCLQERGLDIEDVRLRSLEAIRRLVSLVLTAAQLVWELPRRLAAPLIEWLRQLGGKLGTHADKNGPYVLLYGLSKVFEALTVLHTCPSPQDLPPSSGCG